MMMVTEGAYAYSEAFLPLFSQVFFLYCLKNFSDDDDKSLWRCLIIEFLYLSDRDFFLSLLFLLHALDVTRRGSFFWYASSALSSGNF